MSGNRSTQVVRWLQSVAPHSVRHLESSWDAASRPVWTAARSTSERRSVRPTLRAADRWPDLQGRRVRGEEAFFFGPDGLAAQPGSNAPGACRANHRAQDQTFAADGGDTVHRSVGCEARRCGWRPEPAPSERELLRLPRRRQRRPSMSIGATRQQRHGVDARSAACKLAWSWMCSRRSMAWPVTPSVAIGWNSIGLSRISGTPSA